MTKLPLLPSEEIIKKLKKAGFTIAPTQGKGSHTALYAVGDDGRKLLVIVPKNNPIPRGTLISILKQADLSKEEFISL